MFFAFVKTGTTGVVQTFGKFTRLAKPGLRVYFPGAQKLTVISNQTQAHPSKLYVRTKDGVFPSMDLSILTRIAEEDTKTALFDRIDPIGDMITYVDNSVRSCASNMTLDELFESHAHISKAVLEKVGPIMKLSGFTMLSVEVRGITPPESVTAAMNEMNASERRKLVAKNDGEAFKIQKIQEAEADSARKELDGQGYAKMRHAMMDGYIVSAAEMSRRLNISEAEALKTIHSLMHLDVVRAMANSNNAKTIFIPQSTTVPDMMREAFMQASEATAATTTPASESASAPASQAVS